MANTVFQPEEKKSDENGETGISHFLVSCTLWPVGDHATLLSRQGCLTPNVFIVHFVLILWEKGG